MAAGEFHVHSRLINYSDCGWGSFVFHWLVSLGNMLWKSPLWRLLEGDKVNKDQRWQVSPTKSSHVLTSPPQWLTSDRRLCPQPPHDVSSLSTGFDSKGVPSIHHQHLHFTSTGVTEIGAARAVVKLNVYPGLFLMDRKCGLLTLPLEQTENWLSVALRLTP